MTSGEREPEDTTQISPDTCRIPAQTVVSPSSRSKPFDEVIRTLRDCFTQEELFQNRLLLLDIDQWEALFAQAPAEIIPSSADATRLLMLLDMRRDSR